MKKVSIIISTKNEPFTNELLYNLHNVLANVDHEIIVVDKSDTPPKISDVAKVIIQKSNGLGRGVLEGLNYTRGDVIVTMDGDGSHRAVDVPKLLEKIGDYDIVVGSRFVSGGATEDSINRKITTFVFRKLASLILSPSIEDSMSGFIVAKKGVYNSLNLNPLGYKINMEIVFKGRNIGYKICEAPIVFKKRKMGKSKTGIQTALRTLRYIFELKLGLR